MSDLPSAPIPEEVVGYPVWAVDKRGMALVGSDADEIGSIEVVRAVCEEQSRRKREDPAALFTKCGHIWMYRGGHGTGRPARLATSRCTSTRV